MPDEHPALQARTAVHVRQFHTIAHSVGRFSVEARYMVVRDRVVAVALSDEGACEALMTTVAAVRHAGIRFGEHSVLCATPKTTNVNLATSKVYTYIRVDSGQSQREIGKQSRATP